MNRVKYWIGTFLTYIRKDRWRVTITVLIGGISLLIFAITFQILQNTFTHSESEKTYIFIKGETSEDELQGIIKYLRKKNIKIIRIISPEYKLRYLYGENIPEELFMVTPYTIMVKNKINESFFPNKLKKNIEGITYTAPGELRIRKITKIVRSFLLLFSLTLIGGIIVITIFTIQLSFISHREEIEILKLLGADTIFISIPLFMEGIFIGTASSILGIALLIIIKTIWKKYPAQILQLDITTMIVTITVGIVTGLISSYLSLASKKNYEVF